MLEATGERFVPKKEKNTFTVIEHYHRYNAVAPYMKGLNVLDAGSGAGYGSYLLSDYAKSVTGIDISREAVGFSNETYARERDHLKYITASVGKMPFEDAVFDAVVSFEVIEHISPKMQELFLKEIKRVLKPDGFAVVSSPNREVYSEEIGFSNPYHISELTIDEFKNKISEHFLSSRYYYQTYEPFSIIFDDEHQSNKPFNIIDIQEGSYYHRTYSIAVCADRDESFAGIELNSIVLRYNENYYNEQNSRNYCYISGLYYSESDGFDEQHKQRKTLHIFNGQVDQEYLFKEPVYIKKARWDPVELAFCEIWSPVFEVTLENGDIRTIKAGEAVHNGEKTEDHSILFCDIDPAFVLSIDANVRALRVKAGMAVMDNMAIYNRIVRPAEIQNSRLEQKLAAQKEALAKTNKDMELFKLKYIQTDKALRDMLKTVSEKDMQINYLQTKLSTRIWNYVAKKLKRK
jgi:ubiquinone/menaquinone biosynthesis C-methylase UbiE